MQNLSLEQQEAIANLFTSTIQVLNFDSKTQHLNAFAELTDYAYPFCEEMKVLGFNLDPWEVVRGYMNDIEGA